MFFVNEIQYFSCRYLHKMIIQPTPTIINLVEMIFIAKKNVLFYVIICFICWKLNVDYKRDIYISSGRHLGFAHIIKLYIYVSTYFIHLNYHYKQSILYSVVNFFFIFKLIRLIFANCFDFFQVHNKLYQRHK